MSCLSNFPTTNIIYNCKDVPAPEDHAAPVQDQPDPPQPAAPSRRKRKRNAEISELKRKLDTAKTELALRDEELTKRGEELMSVRAELERSEMANSVHAKRERARRAILATKKLLSRDPNARWKKQRVIQNYINYHPVISRLADEDWFCIGIQPLPKNSFPQHANAPAHHITFELEFFKKGYPTKKIHPCAKKITDQDD